MKPFIERWHLKSEQDSMMRLIIAGQLSWLYLSSRADSIWSAFLALLKCYCQILTCKFRPGWVKEGSLHTEIKHFWVGGCGAGSIKTYIYPDKIIVFEDPWSDYIWLGSWTDWVSGRASDLPSAQEYISRQLHRRLLDRIGVVSEPMSCNLRWQTQYYVIWTNWTKMIGKQSKKKN